MALTFGIVAGLIQHTLGRAPSSEVGANLIANQAGQYLARCHPWKWLVRPPTLLDLRGSISVAGASWTDVSKTLTQTGAFTNYTYKAGDQIVITSGTSTTLGTYDVASRVSANAITLTSSIGASASAVAGSLSFPWIVLPTDFAECLKLQGATSNLSIALTTYQQIIDARALGLSGSSAVYQAALMWRAAVLGLSSAEAAPVPRLELDRIPSANQAGAFNLIYRAGWPRVSDDSAFAIIPEFVEPLFVQIVRAVARGFMEEDAASVDERLALIRGGPVFEAARRGDAMGQRHYGQLPPSDIGRDSSGGDGWLSSPVAPPLSA